MCPEALEQPSFVCTFRRYIAGLSESPQNPPLWSCFSPVARWHTRTLVDELDYSIGLSILEHGLVSAIELGYAEDTGAIEVLYIVLYCIVNTNLMGFYIRSALSITCIPLGCKHVSP